MAPEDKHEQDVAEEEDEGEHALEAVSGAPWRDQLRCLPWRRYPLMTTTCNRQAAPRPASVILLNKDR
ncbi:hypothetical protein G5714_004490 [Onychostoma macrolepis]|uniref:Uncharacterized protein n=1 Tax=Onychostoma macrolepis TaxID=369639 RepID=A0A7J6D4W4_9TELE|nr:hypothetical protein G5714_004490 [Onychostoma macrolepis]